MARAAIACQGVPQKWLAAFLPLYGTTPAATSNGAIAANVYGSPGTITNPTHPPAAGSGERSFPFASPSYAMSVPGGPGVERGWAKSIYYQRIMFIRRGTFPAKWYPNHSILPEPAGNPRDGAPQSAARIPKVGGRRSMFQRRTLVQWLNLDGSNAE